MNTLNFLHLLRSGENGNNIKNIFYLPIKLLISLFRGKISPIPACLIIIYSILMNSLTFAAVRTNSPVQQIEVKNELPQETDPLNSTDSGIQENVAIFNQKFERKGKQTRYSQTFALPAGAVAPYILQIENGDSDGTGRVLDGVIKINGEIVASPENISPLHGTISLRLGSLNSYNAIDVEFFSIKKEASLTITILASIRTPNSPPPVISNFTPESGIPGTSVDLNGLRLTAGVRSETSQTRVTFSGQDNARIAAQVVFRNSDAG